MLGHCRGVRRSFPWGGSVLFWWISGLDCWRWEVEGCRAVGLERRGRGQSIGSERDLKTGGLGEKKGDAPAQKLKGRVEQHLTPLRLSPPWRPAAPLSSYRRPCGPAAPRKAKTRRRPPRLSLIHTRPLDWRAKNRAVGHRRVRCRDLMKRWDRSDDTECFLMASMG